MPVVVDPIQYDRLRRDVGASIAVFDNTAAQAFFDESDEKYPNDTAKMLAYARVIAIRGIRASSAMLGRYAQNHSMEDLTKVFDNLTVMLREAIEEVDKVSDPLEVGTDPFFFGTASGRRGF